MSQLVVAASRPRAKVGGRGGDAMLLVSSAGSRNMQCQLLHKRPSWDHKLKSGFACLHLGPKS